MQLISHLPQLPARPAEGHKGTFGRVLLLVGSRGMSGAAILAGLGALRGGAGLVTLGIPRSIQIVAAAAEPAYLTWDLPESLSGQLAWSAQPQLAARLEQFDAVGCGSGWGMSYDLTRILDWLLKSAACPLVIDADGLNILSRRLYRWSEPAGPRILTPHPGEFARLIQTDIRTVQANRVDLAAEFARRYGVIVLLKGAGTVITDGERVAINGTGNAGMATGGTGDVLTGLLTALLGQGCPPFEAAQLAAHIHGLAGDLAAAELSQPGLIASDLPRYIARAWQQLIG